MDTHPPTSDMSAQPCKQTNEQTRNPGLWDGDFRPCVEMSKAFGAKRGEWRRGGWERGRLGPQGPLQAADKGQRPAWQGLGEQRGGSDRCMGEKWPQNSKTSQSQVRGGAHKGGLQRGQWRPWLQVCPAGRGKKRSEPPQGRSVLWSCRESCEHLLGTARE